MTVFVVLHGHRLFVSLLCYVISTDVAYFASFVLFFPVADLCAFTGTSTLGNTQGFDVASYSPQSHDLGMIVAGVSQSEQSQAYMFSVFAGLEGIYAKPGP